MFSLDGDASAADANRIVRYPIMFYAVDNCRILPWGGRVAAVKRSYLSFVILPCNEPQRIDPVDRVQRIGVMIQPAMQPKRVLTGVSAVFRIKVSIKIVV